jgi:hypothetical protein
MASPLATAFVRIRPDATSFKSETEKSVNKGAKDSGSKYGSIFGKAASAAMIGGAIIGAFTKMITDARSLGLAPLKVAVKNAGDAWGPFNAQLGIASKGMEKLGFTNADTNAAMTKLVTITGNQSLSFKVLGTAADLARYKHISLADASLALGRAATGNTRAMKELGIATNMLPPKFASTGTEASRMAIVMGILNKKIGGEAASAAATFGGKLSVAKAQITDASAKIGTQLIPILVSLLNVFTQYFLPGLQAIIVAAQWVGREFAKLPGPIKAITLVMLAWAAADLIWSLTNPATAIIVLVAAVVFAVGIIVKNWSRIVAAASAALNSVISFFRELPGRILAAIGNFGSLLYNKGKDVIQGFLNGLLEKWKAVTSWVSGIANWIVKHKGPLSLDAKLLHPAGVAMMTGFLGGLKSGYSKVTSFIGGAGGKVSAGVAQWAPTVLQALAMLGLPSNLLGLVLNQMSSESGGNARAINNSDINAQMGDPSRGLMQTIGATFEYWRSKLLPDDIYNPLANVYAALNYAMHGKGFGTGMGQIGSMHGYAMGGVINEPIVGVGRSGQRYSFGENGRETVTPGVGRGTTINNYNDIKETADVDLITHRMTWALQHAGLG